MTIFSPSFRTPFSSPTSPIYSSKLVGEIMITAIVSAIGGPILSVVSGCLGESGMQRLWLWNLVPTQVNILGSDVP